MQIIELKRIKKKRTIKYLDSIKKYIEDNNINDAEILLCMRWNTKEGQDYNYFDNNLELDKSLSLMKLCEYKMINDITN